MRQEINALEHNSTLTLISLPSGKFALISKWVFRIKYKADGTIERYRARLMILGNPQTESVDFTKTFILVAKTSIVRTILCVASARNWLVHQMDVHNVFPHGALMETVYMHPPPDFQTSFPGQVCCLQKSLYKL